MNCSIRFGLSLGGGTCLSLWILAFAPAARSQDVADVYSGLLTESETRFKKWIEVHDALKTSFDNDIGVKLAARTSAGSGAFALCTSGYKERIQGVEIALDNQIEGQRHYYERHAEEAKQALRDKGAVIRALEADEVQKAKLLKTREEELRLIEEQREQVRQNKGENVDALLAQLSELIKNLKERIELMKKEASDFSPKTKLSQSKVYQDLESRLADAIDQGKLLDVQSTYWHSYYAMLRAQIDEHCPPPPMRRVLQAK